MTIQENDIRAELCYAYFHAVVSRAGFACGYTHRLLDGLGVDAHIDVLEEIAPDSILTDFSIRVQLKATSQEPALNNGRYSFRLEREHYDQLRNPRTDTHRLLVVMYLPNDIEQWLSHSEDGLVSRRCAYWVSLKGAPPVQSDTKTIYVPQANLLSSDAIRALMARYSREEEILYGG